MEEVGYPKLVMVQARCWYFVFGKTRVQPLYCYVAYFNKVTEVGI